MGSALSIPLQAQAPQPNPPPSMIQTIGGIMGIAGQMSELASRRAQAADLSAQAAQRNRNLADQNTLGAKMNDPAFTTEFYAGGARTVQALSGLNLQGSTIQNAITHVNDTIAKQALTEKDTLGNQAAATSQLKDLGKNLMQPDADGTPPTLDVINSRWQSAAPEVARLTKQAGINTPPGTFGSIDQLETALAGVHALSSVRDAAIAQKGKLAETSKNSADAAQANAQAEHLAATLPKDQADAQTAQLIADFAKAHGGLTPDQAATTQETARHNKVQEGIGQGELGIKQKTFEATLGSGLDANGQPMAPEAMKQAALQDPTAVAIAHYQVAPPPATTRGGLPNTVLRKVLAINPQYDATTYPARAETARGFSPSGQQGQAITAADTALAHLNTLSAAGKALDNGDVQLINRVANAIGAQVGQTPKATYDTILNMVGPEISKAVIGAVGGEGERAGTAANFDSKLSSPQREANIAAAVGLLGARFDKASHAYESQMGVPLPRTLSPESQSIRAHYSGGQSGAGKTVTKSDVQDYATKHGLSYADAETHVKANGFTVQ
jgi:hypothetical protein